MTDIQRHLKGIRKILYTAITESAEQDAMDAEIVRSTIRKFLPKGYGVGSGVLVRNGELSASTQIIIYDVPLAGSISPDITQEYPIETALLTIDFAGEISLQRLAEWIANIATIKELANFRDVKSRVNDRPVGQARRIIPTDRLPFSLLYFDRLDDSKASYDEIIAEMHQYPAHLLPDQIDIIGQHAQYLNPLLERYPANPTDISWSQTPNLRKPENCYVCKKKYLRRHFYYEHLCMACGDMNYSKRTQSADLTGYRVLITGARVKIGYAAALRLLRAGAEVIVTTRFPRNAAQRYSQEPDFAEWSEHLHIYGLDLRLIVHLEEFIAHLKMTYPHLDAIIHNAAQTVKRPPAFYAHLIADETTPLDQLPESVRLLLHDDGSDTTYIQPSIVGLLEGAEDDKDFPAGEYDRHGQQVDNRDFNSWVMQLEHVSPREFAEVHFVNAIAPGILTGQLKNLLARSPHEAKFIINVSATEGRFAQHKNGYHPHTNMAKAALNMLTRTIADHYAQDGIFVTSVDPGWVSDQVPRTGEDSRIVANDKLPIDMIDAAARLCDPIFSNVNGESPDYGVLLKDYCTVSW